MSNHDEIRDLLASLRGLPWTAEQNYGLITNGKDGGSGWETVAEMCSGGRAANEANAKFIAAAPSIVESLLAECERLTERVERLVDAKAECAEYTALFNLRRDADRRAIVRWQEATGRKAVLPDHADLCVWLMDEVQRVYAITVAEREKAAVVQSIADEMIQRVAELEAERDEARAELARAQELIEARYKTEREAIKTSQNPTYREALADGLDVALTLIERAKGGQAK